MPTEVTNPISCHRTLLYTPFILVDRRIKDCSIPDHRQKEYETSRAGIASSHTRSVPLVQLENHERQSAREVWRIYMGITGVLCCNEVLMHGLVLCVKRCTADVEEILLKKG